MNILIDAMIARARDLLLRHFRAWTDYLRRPWVRVALGGLILIACLSYLVHMVLSIPALPAMTQVNVPWLFGALVITVVTVWLGALEWWLVLRSLGHTIDFREAAQAHLKANLAKYLPGYGWQLLGKIQLTTRPGLPYSAVSAALAIEFALIVLVGVCLALSLAPTFPRVGQTWKLSELGAAAFILLAGLTWIVPAFAQRWRSTGQTTTIRRESLLATLALAALGWVGLGSLFWATSAAFWPLTLADLPVFSFAMIMAMLIGLFAIFVPAGLGVRESALVFILSSSLPPATILFIAAAVRVVLLLGELVCLVLIACVVRFARQDKHPLG